MDKYNAVALFSGDADFVSLIRFLRKRGNSKKVILFKGGHIVRDLREASDRVINAQLIKRYITKIDKQKPGN